MTTEDPFDFDIDSLRVPPDAASDVGLRRVLTTVPVRKPHRQEYVRVHPDADTWNFLAYVVVMKDEGTTYILTREMYEELSPQEATQKLLVTAATRQGAVFLWPLTLPDDLGRHNLWHESELAAAEKAKTQWIRMGANRDAGYYETFVTTADNLPEPKWPESPVTCVQDLVRLAFKGKIVSDREHSVMKHFRGEK